MKSHPSKFTIAYCYMTLMQSSGGHCIIAGFFFPLPFLVAMQHAPSLSSATKTFEASKIRDSFRESPRQVKIPIHSV